MLGQLPMGVYPKALTLVDIDVVNNSDSAANTAVPAEFAGVLAAERSVGNAGLTY
jgi:hypothetical protein